MCFLGAKNTAYFICKTPHSYYNPPHYELHFLEVYENTHVTRLIIIIMIAVIEVGGKQYTVQKGDEITVDRQNTDKKTMTLKPMLVSDAEGKETEIGTPFLEERKVGLKIVDHIKGEKIKVFKMKAKKRYARTRGFRPHQTILKVTSIA